MLRFFRTMLANALAGALTNRASRREGLAISPGNASAKRLRHS